MAVRMRRARWVFCHTTRNKSKHNRDKQAQTLGCRGAMATEVTRPCPHANPARSSFNLELNAVFYKGWNSDMQRRQPWTHCLKAQRDHGVASDPHTRVSGLRTGTRQTAGQRSDRA
jgi:hypothetical protein